MIKKIRELIKSSQLLHSVGKLKNKTEEEWTSNLTIKFIITNKRKIPLKSVNKLMMTEI